MISLNSFKKVAEYSDSELKWFEQCNIGAVYLILFDDEYYIGSTYLLEQRIRQHLNELLREEHHSIKTQKKFNKNKSFDVYLLDYGRPISDLRRIEADFLDTYKPSLNTCLVNKKKPKPLNTNPGTMKDNLKDIILSISWSDLAKKYFGKSNSWLYHKMDGRDGNGKPTEFTKEETEQLRNALFDLSSRIRIAAEKI